MSNALKKITTRAKQIRKAHPNTSWKSAVKKAGSEYRSKHKKLSGTHSKKRGMAKRHHKPKKRVGATRTNKSHQDFGGDRKKVDITIGSMTPAQKVKLAKDSLKEANAWHYVAMQSAKSKRAKNKIRKKIAENAMKIRALEK